MTKWTKLFQNLDKQIVAQFVVVIVFLLVCYWIAIQPNPFEVADLPPAPQSEHIAPPNPTQLAASATAYQIEIEENRDQTLGIVLGGGILLALTIGGTLLVLGKQ
ncbi:hypothetical protein [Leptolinea tardivitalis]|uniref:Uncharacterized protein n=1 Tax=Leptolinea tardivitalis TaxID=229920 RepID=A0A0N8GL02_9CHLR|nr:hypothetical protein [Leptolinea tardivitalis]KPL71130.1 hypothetical protein ADM99_12765 [Leptolinea tardivitalis]GAP22563.1 hypothetical protein LTAR_02796 [Leptolinea tardivitalis]